MAVGRRRMRSRQRGFTLTELMAVVAIMGILATMAITAFVGHSKASKTGEAMAVVQAIRGAQERYRSEHQVYLDRDSKEWYPTNGIGDTRASFVASGNEYDELWKRLNPAVNRPVGFGYWVDTGLPGEELPTVATSKKFASGSSVSEPWYVVQAQADVDDDGTFCRVVASSMNPEVIIENDGE